MPPKSSSEVEDPSTSFLGNISQDYDAEEKTSEAVTAHWQNLSTNVSLADGKYNEKLDIYGRPSNCDRFGGMRDAGGGIWLLFEI